MKRLELVAEARTFAAEKHKNQKDKNGDAYFNHLAAVAQGVRTLGGSLEEIAAAYLHDVVEDCKDVSYASLLNSGFPPAVVRIVWAVTKQPSELQKDYLARVVATGPGAMRVKAADLLHNLRADRLAGLQSYTRERLEQKYRPSLARLLIELGYLQPLADQTEQQKLATKPIGTSTGSYYTSSDDYAHKDPGGWTTGESSKFYSLKSLMAGDWPAQASAPIKQAVDKDKQLYELEDGTQWTSKLPRIRVWPDANHKARKVAEAKRGNLNWSPTTESLSGALVVKQGKAAGKVTHTVKQVTTGSDKKNS